MPPKPPERWAWPNRQLWQPLPEGHEALGAACVLCGDPMKVGDMPTIITLGPASLEDARKAAVGEPHILDARVAHWECARTAVASLERARGGIAGPAS